MAKRQKAKPLCCSRCRLPAGETVLIIQVLAPVYELRRAWHRDATTPCVRRLGDPIAPDVLAHINSLGRGAQCLDRVGCAERVQAEYDRRRAIGAHRRVPIPHRTAPKGTCQWCGEAIKHGRKDRRWHDGREDEPRCLHEYNALTNRHYQAKVLRERDGAACRSCGAPEGAPIPTTRQWHGTTVVLQVDHVTPLIDGGGHDLSNLQLLCVACHKTKTAGEATARAAARRGPVEPDRQMALDVDAA